MDQPYQKYLNLRVPRYTSYPTAPQFTGQIGESDLRGWLADIPAKTSLSLYLHIPFCQKMCWYCGCNMKLAARYDPVAAYVERLMEEIALVAGALPGRYKVSHIHWGGGTPTTLSPHDFGRIDEMLRRHFDIVPDAEIAVEIDPRTLQKETVGALARMGCNRASLGVQEFDVQVQSAINRIQPFETVEAVTKQLRAYGIDAVNFDLMYGLPHQTSALLDDTIRRAISLKPDRIALFGYAHVPWMAKNQRMIEEDSLPDARARFIMSEEAGALIEDLGYQRIGIDHFARPEDSLAIAARNGRLRRNFQGYTSDGADVLIGFGASAISALPQGYTQNIVESGAYMRALGKGEFPITKGLRLTGDDRFRRAIIERLMCDFQADLFTICADHDMTIDALGPSLDQLETYIADGFATCEHGHLRITRTGRPIARLIAAAFDAYLPGNTSERRHARL